MLAWLVRKGKILYFTLSSLLEKAFLTVNTPYTAYHMDIMMINENNQQASRYLRGHMTYVIR